MQASVRFGTRCLGRGVEAGVLGVWGRKCNREHMLAAPCPCCNDNPHPKASASVLSLRAVSYTHLRAHETEADL
eukprot:3404294-Rhodomonas_salina.3